VKESNFQTEFGKKNKIVGVFELKFCKGTSLPFKALAEHQEKALIAANTGKGLFHKITDQPVFAESGVRFTKKKPFDCFYLKFTDAYVVIMWWIPRKKKNVYYIHIKDWVTMRKEANRKSVTEDMAKWYACLIEDYLKK